MRGDTFVLSLGGIDPSAGAGVFSDVKTFEHCGVMGLAVPTCLTFQNHAEVQGVDWFSIEKIIQQLDALKGHYAIRFCKIALVKDWEMLRTLATYLKTHFQDIKIILDPVLKASSGYEICPEPNRSLRDEVLSSIYLITPNKEESKRLNLNEDARYPCHIYFKSNGPELGEDLLLENNGAKAQFKMHAKGSEKHGSGCVFSAALVSNLAKQEELKTACALAKQTVERYLQSNTNLIGTLL